MAITTLFLFAPLCVLLWISFHYGYPMEDLAEPSLRSYGIVLTDRYFLGILLRTIGMACAITGLALFLGFPIAVFLARTQSRYKNIILLAVILPLFVGNAVRAIGWMLVLGQQGIVNKVASFADIGPFAIMYSGTAVLVGAATVNMPYIILTLQSVIERLDPALEEASLSLGATRLETWRLVVLPLIAPGILAACTLSFILGMNAYATPVLLGGPRFRMMAPTVAEEILVKSNWAAGAVLAFLLIVVTLSLTIAINRMLRRGIGGAA